MAKFYRAILETDIPNIEMHLYGNGRHDGGIRYRNGAAYGTWQDRFIEWFRDLGFLQKPGIETKAAKDLKAG